MKRNNYEKKVSNTDIYYTMITKAKYVNRFENKTNVEIPDFP